MTGGVRSGGDGGAGRGRRRRAILGSCLIALSTWVPRNADAEGMMENGPPDHQNGGVDTWVVTKDFEWTGELREGGHVLRGIEFAIEVAGTPAGSATLWLDAETWLPVRRTQTVNFPGGRMDVIESYESFVVRP
ncbi:MAG: hypothetical protein R3E97_12860 [Candidatus Eisenbacteria bacterium]